MRPWKIPWKNKADEKMIPDINLSDLLSYGGVYKNIEGSDYEEVFRNICNRIELPESLTPDMLYDALCAREQILTTAVGNGIAIPHARAPMIKEFTDQRIAVCYLKEPIDMASPDGKKVFVMFVILTSSTQSHMQVISRLAGLLKNDTFKSALENQIGLEGLLALANVY